MELLIKENRINSIISYIINQTSSSIKKTDKNRYLYLYVDIFIAFFFIESMYNTEFPHLYSPTRTLPALILLFFIL